MKKKLTASIALILVFGSIVYIFFNRNHSTDKTPAVVEPQQKTEYIVRGMPPNPPLVKIHGQPITEQAKAQWEWWHSMMKQDRGFQWRMPISFYGKVIDQFGDPVSEAKVDLGWTSDGYESKRTLYTDSDGLFSLEQANGKRLTATVFKKGYRKPNDGSSGGSFEYADFSQSIFHVPDKENPYILYLQKLISPEPLYKHWTRKRTTGDGNEVHIKLANGKFEETEALSIAIKQDPIQGDRAPNQVLTVTMTNGGGLIQVPNENPVMAPEQGYSTSLQFKQNLSDPVFRKDPSVYLYIKTKLGRYAWVKIRMRHNVRWQPSCEILHYYNPSGSRNLEVDDSLLIESR